MLRGPAAGRAHETIGCGREGRRCTVLGRGTPRLRLLRKPTHATWSTPGWATSRRAFFPPRSRSSRIASTARQKLYRSLMRSREVWRSLILRTSSPVAAPSEWSFVGSCSTDLIPELQEKCKNEDPSDFRRHAHCPRRNIDLTIERDALRFVQTYLGAGPGMADPARAILDGLAVGDFDEDGTVEVAVAEDNGGEVLRFEVQRTASGFWHLRGDGSSPTTYDKGDEITACDIDGHGRSEILVAEDNRGRVDVFPPHRLHHFVQTNFDNGDGLGCNRVDGKSTISVAEDKDDLVSLFPH